MEGAIAAALWLSQRCAPTRNANPVTRVPTFRARDLRRAVA